MELKIRKISRAYFMKIMEGKSVSLISACVVGKNVLEKAIKSLDDTEKYRKVTTTPIDNAYTGVFHKQSKGFYRLMADGTKSYKEFSKGDYVLSDGKLSFIINPFTMNVCVYRLETL